MAAILLLSACQGVETREVSQPDAPPALPQSGKLVRFMVPEANCVSNGAKVDHLLRGLEGVSSVYVNLNKATATMRYDPAVTSTGRIREALENELWEVTGVEELE